METDGFEISGDFCVYRPVGRVSIDEASRLVCEALQSAREKGIRKLLVDITRLTGFGTPGTWERFWIAVEFAQAAGARVIMAMVAPAELIDPQKFGVTVARNRGLVCDIFTAESEAARWLAAVPIRTDGFSIRPEKVDRSEGH